MGMKKILTILCSACVAAAGTVMCGFEVKSNEADNLTADCKSAYLMDFNSGECIYKQNETKRMPIASVCKVMTLTLCMDALASEQLSLDDKITVSESASGMGGSQVFLGTGCEYTVDQLIKSIVVCSANDSCVALSETIAGSEESFVAKMNSKAAELGCNDT